MIISLTIDMVIFFFKNSLYDQRSINLRINFTVD